MLSKRRKPPTMEAEPTDGVGIFNMPFTMAGPPHPPAADVGEWRNQRLIARAVWGPGADTGRSDGDALPVPRLPHPQVHHGQARGPIERIATIAIML